MSVSTMTYAGMAGLYACDLERTSLHAAYALGRVRRLCRHPQRRRPRVAIAIFGAMLDLAFDHGPPVLLLRSDGWRPHPDRHASETGIQGTSYDDRGPYAARICRSVSSRDR